MKKKSNAADLLGLGWSARKKIPNLGLMSEETTISATNEKISSAVDNKPSSLPPPSSSPSLTPRLANPAFQAPHSAPTAVIELFRKELIPSDIGQPIRLHIPMHAVEKLISLKVVAANSQRNDGDKSMNWGLNEGKMVKVTDLKRRQWEFKFSSQTHRPRSYFSEDWKKLVEEEKLKAKDVVIFYVVVSIGDDDKDCKAERHSSELLIDVSRHCSEGEDKKDKEEEEKKREREVVMEEAPRRKPIKLFGAVIGFT